MIGIFVLAAFGIIIFMMLFLHPNISNEGKTLRVRFADIDKITAGTRVTFAGKPVGEVVEVREIENGERIDKNNSVYIYELELAVDTSVSVYTTDMILSRTSGLLGEKSVAILPQVAKKGEKRILVTDEILYANETGSVESTLKEFTELTNKIERTLDDVIEAFGILREKKTWDNIGDTIKNVQEMTAAINETKIWVDAAEAAKNINSITAVFNDPAKLNGVFDNLAAMSNSGKNILSGIERGDGSLGKILVKDDFYLRLASLMSKAEVILNDVNHYGVLFHLDKGWQRLRARRLNLLQTLQTPQEFRNYFNDEIDSIAVTLQRVSMVIEEVESLPCQSLWQDPNYVKVYSELLRRVATLEEYLQMYNQQVVDCQVHQTELIDYQ